MDNLTATKKLFHAIVVIGMATSLGACSSGTTSTMDASADGPAADGNAGMDAGKDVAQSNDAAEEGDGFSGWMGC